MAEEVKFTEDEAKLLAAEMKGIATEFRRHTVDQASAMARWLVASLLAVNSGALLAVLNSDTLTLDGKYWAGGVFAAGLCAALLTGYANINAATSLLPSIAMQEGFWTAIGHHGQYDEAAKVELDDQIKKAHKPSKLPDITGGISFLLIVVGLITVGVNLEGTRPTDIGQCRVEAPQQ